MILLDGSQGEGGGQILRSALALSVVTGLPFHITRIRAGRAKPGLMRQHLACVEAAARVGAARVEGAALGATELTFAPFGLVPGFHEFRIASAGSTLLVLQTILPPLMLAERRSEIVLEGGTHNPFAPPFPFIAEAFLPLLRRIGFPVDATLERAGFYPNGGGRCRWVIEPARDLSPLTLEAGRETKAGSAAISAHICLAGLPRSVADRELEIVRNRLEIPPNRCVVEACAEALGPGNTVHLHVQRDGVSEVFTGFGALRVRSEDVARGVVDELQSFVASGATVGEHLADQLLLPLALARGGSFVT